jgi:hypothetical protein
MTRRGMCASAFLHYVATMRSFKSPGYQAHTPQSTILFHKQNTCPPLFISCFLFLLLSLQHHRPQVIMFKKVTRYGHTLYEVNVRVRTGNLYFSCQMGAVV